MFSDIHRGNGGENDRFNNESIYLNALSYYKNKYNLVLLGDIEEGWGYKHDLGSVINHNNQSIGIEREFVKNNRYIRIIGNHDDVWVSPEEVLEYLSAGSREPVIDPLPAVILAQGDKKILLIHGCQGNNFGDMGDRFSRFVINIKFRTGFIRSTLKEFEKRRRKLRKHEMQILKWAKGKKMIVVIGHTHTPYFMSMPNVRFEQKLLKNVEKSLKTAIDKFSMKQLKKSKRSLENIIQSVNDQEKEIKKVVDDISPAVFNTGNCCKDIDEISGIEISNGTIKEVYWKKDSEKPEIVRQKKLTEIFKKI
jgi:UDP-2,3-diacylglucosamine pyrophosphatase LpxH